MKTHIGHMCVCVCVCVWDKHVCAIELAADRSANNGCGVQKLLTLLVYGVLHNHCVE